LEKKFRQTFEKMEGFSFVTPVAGLNRPNTGKEDDDEDDDDDDDDEIYVTFRRQRLRFMSAQRTARITYICARVCTVYCLVFQHNH
jgi:hypothetical protein